MNHGLSEKSGIILVGAGPQALKYLQSISVLQEATKKQIPLLGVADTNLLLARQYTERASSTYDRSLLDASSSVTNAIRTAVSAGVENIVICVCVSAHLHVHVANEIFSSNNHGIIRGIIFEKPFGAGLSEANFLYKECTERGWQVGVQSQLLYSTVLTRAKEALSSSAELGNHLSANFRESKPTIVSIWSDWDKDRTQRTFRTKPQNTNVRRPHWVRFEFPHVLDITTELLGQKLQLTDVSGEHFELDLSSCHPEWAQEYPEYVVTPDVDTSVSVPTARVPFLRRGKAYLHSENGTPVTISSFQQSSVLRREVKVYLNEGKYCLVLKFDICEDSVHGVRGIPVGKLELYTADNYSLREQIGDSGDIEDNSLVASLSTQYSDILKGKEPLSSAPRFFDNLALQDQAVQIMDETLPVKNRNA